MAEYIGDFKPGDTIRFKFNTRTLAQVPITFAGSPVLSIYKDGNSTESTAGTTLTVDFDGKTGLHDFVINTAADGAFYSSGSMFSVVVTSGTVNGQSVVAETVREFSLGLGNKDTNVVQISGDSVAADNAEAFFDGTGYAGTNNTIPTVTNLTNLPTIPNNWLTAAGIASGAFTSAKFASGAFDAVWTVTTRTLSATGVSAIVASIWDELTATIRVVGSYGERVAGMLNATVSSRASEANATTNYNNLANLITALNNLSAKMNIFGAPLLEIPDSGSTVYAFTVVVKDDEDKLVNLDASPTLAAANAAATDRSANLSAVSNPSTGRYTFTYTVANTHAKESLRITVSGTVSAEARYIEWIGAVVDYDTLTTLQDVQTRVIDLQTQVGTDGAGLTAIGDARLANLDATVSSRASAAALTTVEGKVDSLLARITTNLFTGITSLADWLRRGFRKDSGSAGMIAAEAEINTGGTATFLGTTDSLEAIRDRGDAAWTTGSGGGGGSGTGARTVAITVTVDSVLQEGAKVRVTKGVETYIVATNVSGVATFNLDDGTWTIAITAPFATFAGASLVVDANVTQTYDMDAVHLSPSDPDKVTAYYLCLDENGDPEAGVEVTIQVKEASAGLGVVDGLALGDPPRTATSDANGMASFVNTIPGYVYIVSCGGNRQHMVEIPQDADTPFPLRSIVR